MKKYLFYICFLLLPFFLVTCTKEDSPTEPAGQQELMLAGTQPIPDFRNQTNFNGVMGAISYDFSQMGEIPITIPMAFAVMGQGVDGGTITVNGNQLIKGTEAGKTYYSAPSPLNPTQLPTNLSFNSSVHNWTVTGGSGIPPFSGNVTTPSAYSVTSPASNAPVSKSSQLQVRWGNPSSARVLIILQSQNGGKFYLAQDQPDNGQHIIGTDQLGGFPAGGAILYIIKYTYNAVTANDGKTYIMMAEIVKTSTITLN